MGIGSWVATGDHAMTRIAPSSSRSTQLRLLAPAAVPVEQPLGRERGPMAAAEIGRHLAILGASHLGLQQRRASSCVPGAQRRRGGVTF